VIEAVYPDLKALAGHQWPGEARVEFGGTAPDIGVSVDLINGKLSEEIAAARPVAIVGDPYVDRSIRIGHYQAIPCGGVHIQSLAELREIKVLGKVCKSPGIDVSVDYPGNRIIQGAT
jgi:alanyl-tRNA synthetase